MRFILQTYTDTLASMPIDDEGNLLVHSVMLALLLAVLYVAYRIIKALLGRRKD